MFSLLIHAFFRGWLAGMAALLFEILTISLLFFPSNNLFSLFPSEMTSDPNTLVISAILEEVLVFLAITRILFRDPGVRTPLIIGFSAGAGFAFFEICIKILFLGTGTDPILPGIISGSLLHLTTGTLLGGALLFFRKSMWLQSMSLLAFTILIHLVYNLFFSPALASLWAIYPYSLG